MMRTAPFALFQSEVARFAGAARALDGAFGRFASGADWGNEASGAGMIARRSRITAFAAAFICAFAIAFGSLVSAPVLAYAATPTYTASVDIYGSCYVPGGTHSGDGWSYTSLGANSSGSLTITDCYFTDASISGTEFTLDKMLIDGKASTGARNIHQSSPF